MWGNLSFTHNSSFREQNWCLLDKICGFSSIYQMRLKIGSIFSDWKIFLWIFSTEFILGFRNSDWKFSLRFWGGKVQYWVYLKHYRKFLHFLSDWYKSFPIFACSCNFVGKWNSRRNYKFPEDSENWIKFHKF